MKPPLLCTVLLFRVLTIHISNIKEEVVFVNIELAIHNIVFFHVKIN